MYLRRICVLRKQHPAQPGEAHPAGGRLSEKMQARTKVRILSTLCQLTDLHRYIFHWFGNIGALYSQSHTRNQ
jgi:hypothetical protein